MLIVLDISDLVNVIDLLKQGKFTNSKWSTLGLYIGLLQPTLNEIESNYRDNVERCLQECLTQWLYQADIVCESGGPTLDSLAVALKKIGENVAAEEIKEFSENLINILYVSLLINSFTYMYYSTVGSITSLSSFHMC